MSKRRSKRNKSPNFLLSIMNTWQKFNIDIPDRIETTKSKEILREERQRKLGSRVSNKNNYFTPKEIAIVQELVSNPRKSYVEIAKTLGLSRHTVKKRVEEMLGSSKIKIYLGVNHKKLTIDLILFNLILKNLKYLDEAYQELQNCPRVFSISKDISKNSLTMLLGIEKSSNEDNNQMVCMIERFQSDERVKESSILSLYPEVFPKFLIFKNSIFEEKSNKSGCNSNCNVCDFYLNKRCPGCPANIVYSESFFKMA